MADTNLDPSIISVTNRAVAVASTASPRELLNISRIGPSLEQSENANLEITLNARALDLAPTATANELRSLGMAIGNLLEPQTERIFMDWRHGFIPDQRFADGQFLRTAGSHQKSWGGVTTTTLDELELVSVATGESLVYNSVSGKFENSTNTFAITVYATEADLPDSPLTGSLAYVTDASDVYYFDGSLWTIVQDVFSGIYRGNWQTAANSNDNSTSFTPFVTTGTVIAVDGTEATGGTTAGGSLDTTSRWASSVQDNQNSTSFTAFVTTGTVLMVDGTEATGGTTAGGSLDTTSRWASSVQDNQNSTSFTAFVTTGTVFVVDGTEGTGGVTVGGSVDTTNRWSSGNSKVYNTANSAGVPSWSTTATVLEVDGTEATAGTATSSISLVWDNALANATNLSSLYTTEAAHANENHIVLADGTKNPNVKLFDRSTMTELWSYDDPSFSDGINSKEKLAISDNYVAFVNIRGNGSQGEVNILDINTGSKVATINSGLEGHMKGIITLPNGKLITYGRYSPTYLQQYDMTDPANPVQEWQISTAPTQYQYAGFASEYGQVEGSNSIIAVSANNDTWDGGATQNNSVPEQRLNGRVYLVDTTDGSVRSSVGDPNTPDDQGTNSFRGVAGITSTNKLYVGAPNTDGDQGYEKYEGRIHAFDISDPDNPSLVNSLAPSDYGYGPTGTAAFGRLFGTNAKLSGDYLFAPITESAGVHKVLVIDTSDDSLVVTLDTPSLAAGHDPKPRGTNSGSVIVRLHNTNYLLTAEEVAGPAIVGGSVDTTNRWSSGNSKVYNTANGAGLPSWSTTATVLEVEMAQAATFSGTGTTNGGGFLYTELDQGFRFGPNKWTAECFIRPSPGGDTYQRILGTQAGGFSNSGWTIRTYQNKLQLWAGGAYQTGTTVLSNDTWYHIAVERDNVDFWVYIDGVREFYAPAGSVSDAEGITDSTFLIGGGIFGGIPNPTSPFNTHNTTPSELFKGAIGDVRLTEGNGLYNVTPFTRPSGKLEKRDDTRMLILRDGTFTDEADNPHTINQNDSEVVAGAIEVDS